MAAVSNAGLVSVVGTGELDIRATYLGVMGTLHWLVAKQPAVAVTVTGPSQPSSFAQLLVLARLSDGSVPVLVEIENGVTSC